MNAQCCNLHIQKYWGCNMWCNSSNNLNHHQRILQRVLSQKNGSPGTPFPRIRCSKKGGDLLSRFAEQYHRRARA